MIRVFDFHIEKYDKHCYLCIETCPFEEAGQETSSQLLKFVKDITYLLAQVHARRPSAATKHTECSCSRSLACGLEDPYFQS